MNVDATISQGFSTLATVARDDNGEVIQVWAKLHELCSPLQAEVATVLWTLQIAIEKKWDQITVEGDAKICIDSLVPMSSKGKQVHWCITLIINSLKISKSFMSYKFCWISRKYNGAGAAHTSTKRTGTKLRNKKRTNNNITHLIHTTCHT